MSSPESEKERSDEDTVSHTQLDDLQQLVLERDACFAISYLLLKHLLLSVMFLMAVFTMVRLTLTDSQHVKRVTRNDSTASDSLFVSSNTVTVNVTIGERNTSVNTGNITVNNSTINDTPVARLKGNESDVKFTIFMARFSGIIAICFGILGIITESVTLVLLFVLYTSLRLVTTFFIAAFRQTLVSMFVLFTINLLSFAFVTLMIIRSWQMCLKSNRVRIDSTKKLADKFESAIEVRITVPEDDDLTGDKKDAIINALNRRTSKAPSIASFTLSQLNEAFASLQDHESDRFTSLYPPTTFHRTPCTLSSNRSSQCIPPTMAKALAASLAHARPLPEKDS